MKNTILVLSILGMSSCATPYIREWSEGKVTVCCNGTNCDPVKTEQMAKDHCKSDVKQVGGSMVNGGMVQVVEGQYTNVNYPCSTFKCQDASAEPAKK